MKDEKRGIAVAGSLIADTFYKIDTYPKSGTLANVWDRTMHIGGTGNLIQDLARLDAKLTVKVSAIVGDDDNGKMIRERLSKYANIDLGNLTVEGESAQTLVMNAQDTKERTFFTIPGANDVFEEKYIDWDHIDAKIFQMEYILLMGKVDGPDAEFGTHGARILHEAKQRGMKTSIDIVSSKNEHAKDIISCALKYTDYCSINETEVELATGITVAPDGEFCEEKVKEAMLDLKEKGISEWIVIHSPKCSYGYDCKTDQFLRVPSLKLPDGYIKGTNGAGDAYCSGILYGAYQNYSLEQSMRLATACAACSLSELNGTDGLRPVEQVWELEKQFR